MKTGQLVNVKMAGGETAVRQIVAIEGDTVFVCRPETYKAAKAEGREPAAVGFNRRWVMELPRDAA